MSSVTCVRSWPLKVAAFSLPTPIWLKRRRVLKEVVVPDRSQMLQALLEGRPADLLDRAAEMERNSITYYRGLAEHMSEKGVVLTVLEEELSHLRTLERLGFRLRAERASTS